MVFVALTMNLAAEDAGRLNGEQASLVPTIDVSPRNLFATLNTDLAATLQPALERGALTLAIIKRGKEGCGWRLRVTALADEGLLCLGPLLQALATRPALLWGQRRWAVEAADTGRSPWAATNSWEDLLGQPAGRLLSFHLGTPLVMPSSAEAAGQPTSPFPHPLPVFAELARRWRDLGGPALSADALVACERGGCVVADYRLRSCQVALPERRQSGLLGWVTYECRSAPPQAVAALNALARFAFFAGVGRDTSCGMGATRVAIEP